VEEPQEDWDPWEEFNQHYGDVGGYEYFRNFRSRERQPERKTTVTSREYAVLGLSSTASYEEVKRAYRRKARENHPDMHPTEKEKYTARMAEINAAFEAISRVRKE
jgi:DnaJ-class molecular chaperone